MGRPGMRMRLPPYVQAFTDRHGRARYYFRRPGYQRVPLPGLPYSPEFMAAHSEAMSSNRREAVGESRIAPGTMNALIIAYLNSPAFKCHSNATQTTYRGILEGIGLLHGTKRVTDLQGQHVARLVAAKAATPAAAGNFLRMLRLLSKFAVLHGWRKSDPTTGIRGPKMRQGGFYAWTETDIAQFEAHFAIGTRARLALALLLSTAQRRSDVIRMGRQHIRNEVMTIKQQKTGMAVGIPVLPELRSVIDATQNNHLTFLVTGDGKPFSAAGFGNWFRETCNQAGLPKCSAHGLRKAAARRLAEAGCTAHEIMAITGHKSLREVTRYTESVDRVALAAGAMHKLGKRTSSVKSDRKV
jgi:integrase